VSLAAFPFEDEMLDRTLDVQFAPGVVLPCCTAEDLIVMKAFANRPRDWQDVRSIVKRNSALDKEYVLTHLAMLWEIKDAPEILEKAQELLR